MVSNKKCLSNCKHLLSKSFYITILKKLDLISKNVTINSVEFHDVKTCFLVVTVHSHAYVTPLTVCSTICIGSARDAEHCGQHS